MNFNKVFRYITDRPFLMALIVFVVLFIAYNFIFKNKSTAASTVAQAAIPTSGRPTIYNQEFVQYPITSNPPPASGFPLPPPGFLGPPSKTPSTIVVGKDVPNNSTLRQIASTYGLTLAKLYALNSWLGDPNATSFPPGGSYNPDLPGNVAGATLTIR